MNDLRFEWDEFKNARNRFKHRVSFDEAATAISDPDHSTDEERHVLLGMTARLRLVVVVHCYREDDAVIRIISARRAVESERRQYLDR